MTRKQRWKLVPDWYGYMAQDWDGRWYAFKTEPHVDRRHLEWLDSINSHLFVTHDSENAHWTETLEQRFTNYIPKEYMKKVAELL